MDNWLDKALVDLETQNNTTISEGESEQKRAAIRKSIIALKESGDPYGAIAKYFQEIRSFLSSSRALLVMANHSIEYEFRGQFKTGLTPADWIEGKDGDDNGEYSIRCFSGNRFISDIKLQNGKTVCSVAIDVYICKGKNDEVFPVITLSLFTDKDVDKQQYSLTFHDSASTALTLDWLRTKTSSYLKNLAQSKK